jgi:RNA polymerase sigma-70 factor, ECF subfamily
MEEKVSQKKRDEFIKAYEDLSDAIFRHCSFRISNRELAKDLTQEAFTRTWKYISQGKEIDNLRAFLYKIANNLIIDEYRKKKTVSLELMKESGFDVRDDGHDTITRSSEGREIIKVVEELDDTYRDVIIMRHVDGMSPKEIAEILEVTENVVSVRINRGLKKTRELLKIYYEKNIK